VVGSLFAEAERRTFQHGLTDVGVPAQAQSKVMFS